MGICEITEGRCPFTITFNVKKGTGKAWVKNVIVGQVGHYFPHQRAELSEDKQRGKKIYYLPPGVYLVCEEGTREKDFVYKVKVDEELEMRKVN